MRRQHFLPEEPAPAPSVFWDAYLNCPFDGNKTDYASNIQLTGNGRFITDPITQNNNCAVFTSDSDRMWVELSDFPASYTGKCRIEVDWLWYNASTPQYPNIIDNSKSGNGGILTQRDGGYWHFGITNRGYNVTDTPPFADQRLSIPQANIPTNTWLHLTMKRYLDVEEITVKNNDNTLGYLKNQNLPYFDASVNPHMVRLGIGGSSTLSGRYLNGCLKNLKIYLLSEFGNHLKFNVSLTENSMDEASGVSGTQNGTCVFSSEGCTFTGNNYIVWTNDGWWRTITYTTPFTVIMDYKKTGQVGHANALTTATRSGREYEHGFIFQCANSSPNYFDCGLYSNWEGTSAPRVEGSGTVNIQHTKTGFMYDGNGTLYRIQDGVIQNGSATIQQSKFPNFNDTYITLGGTNNYSSDRWRGTIRNVMIFDKMLTNQELSSL